MYVFNAFHFNTYCVSISFSVCTCTLYLPTYLHFLSLLLPTYICDIFSYVHHPSLCLHYLSEFVSLIFSSILGYVFFFCYVCILYFFFTSSFSQCSSCLLIPSCFVSTFFLRRLLLIPLYICVSFFICLLPTYYGVTFPIFVMPNMASYECIFYLHSILFLHFDSHLVLLYFTASLALFIPIPFFP